MMAPRIIFLFIFFPHNLIHKLAYKLIEEIFGQKTTKFWINIDTFKNNEKAK
jgi:hypothetical protein